jgi:CBS domain-containing protein
MMTVTVADVMTRDVFAVAPNTSLETAARLFATQRISGAPVVGTSGRPIGVVSLSDLTDPDRAVSTREGYPMFYRVDEDGMHSIGDDVEVGEGRVEDVMSPFVFSIESTAALLVAARRMVEEGVHRLLVMDGAELVGVVSSIDLLRGFVRSAG